MNQFNMKWTKNQFGSRQVVGQATVLAHWAQKVGGLPPYPIASAANVYKNDRQISFFVCICVCMHTHINLICILCYFADYFNKLKILRSPRLALFKISILEPT